MSNFNSYDVEKSGFFETVNIENLFIIHFVFASCPQKNLFYRTIVFAHFQNLVIRDKIEFKQASYNRFIGPWNYLGTVKPNCQTTELSENTFFYLKNCNLVFFSHPTGKAALLVRQQNYEKTQLFDDSAT